MRNEVRLSELCSINSGGTPSRSHEAYWGGSIPWAKISDLEASGDGYIYDTQEHITAEGLKAIRGRIFDTDTLLFAMYGSVGKTAIVRGAVSTNQAILGIKPFNKNLDLNYLKHWLNSQQKVFERDAQGVAQKNLSAGYVRDLKIPLIPLIDQRRIAAVLDKADSVRLKRQQAIKLTDEFLRAVFLDLFGDPRTNPKGWNVRSLAEVVRPDSIITYGIVQAGPHIEGGIPYIRTGDFKNGVLAKSGFACTSEQIASKFRRSQVTTGDLVYCIRASIGSVDIVPEYLSGANLTQGTAKISPGKNVEPYFLLEQMRTSGFRAWIDQNSKGATFKEITLAKLREAPIYVPPLKDQLKFVDIRNKAIDKIRNSMVSCDLPLFESLSQKAFSGQL